MDHTIYLRSKPKNKHKIKFAMRICIKVRLKQNNPSEIKTKTVVTNFSPIV